MSSETTEVHHEDHGHGEGMTKKKIIQIFLVLLGITVVEFIIALWLVPSGKVPIHLANPIYIVLTLFKAFYIVAYFMHLKFEKIGLALCIIVPILFIIGLILVLTNESHYWVDLRPKIG
ncbi:MULTISPECIES: cytochrome C oxidase subunit IV family protein [unclassified Mucilaginibacter]|uniref:cytochrome C oxidase subunit IV family protein n=1 Tax=unclassified Mucilaginibacter TaxID=2617802 RepID=UPI002AC912E7|nr:MULTISPECIES: cytochrome C oxidase subunit IV family protein [unclassified Mucilaginibacter]MEB0263957.1 cytochrome C oxidase subunit IV family protein [Mucilaginibacter sp. 10I4]MEB0280127.1 cytochrome C oxidase subunit IV family protein [Mucilaginibacter sp. 10B2]MEB0303287.1 cytochrome C oxidase subunit IV family protein [Mucilaginibacter sp. 5C4]WPX24464.1 cytochrome C oxidase subunit IV family protein [Mucilaginibacter sp. 5C4]